MARQPLCFGKEKVGLLNNQNSTLEESESEEKTNAVNRRLQSESVTFNNHLKEIGT